MKVTDYLKVNINKEIVNRRKDIRLLKKEIKYLESMKTALQSKSEKDLLDMLKEDPKLIEDYNNLSAQVEDKSKKEIQRMFKEGILKEAQVDEKGKIIPEEGSEDKLSGSSATDSAM